MSQEPENSKAIQLELYITPFNFSTGLLVPTNDKPSKWLTHKDMPGHDRPFTERIEKDVSNFHRGDDFHDNIPDSEDFRHVVRNQQQIFRCCTIDCAIYGSTNRCSVSSSSIGRNFYTPSWKRRLGWVPWVQTADNWSS
ncbi:uncharacterized protein LOC123271147 [Cotesia glomerata]|uniref:uncharacterized protein LOC123271147 n=1 Tax=Cotesia glomerata TaxID=32391 RepID=UPI001D01A742|nr:uncharacterized protein LOC123271147 [Cotesia glomerata]